MEIKERPENHWKIRALSKMYQSMSFLTYKHNTAPHFGLQSKIINIETWILNNLN